MVGRDTTVIIGHLFYRKQILLVNFHPVRLLKISHLFYRKQILLVNFRPLIYFIGSNDLYNLERLLVSFNSVLFKLNTWNIGAVRKFYRQAIYDAQTF